jgi:hypothetical protein
MDCKKVLLKYWQQNYIKNGLLLVAYCILTFFQTGLQMCIIIDPCGTGKRSQIKMVLTSGFIIFREYSRKKNRLLHVVNYSFLTQGVIVVILPLAPVTGN